MQKDNYTLNKTNCYEICDYYFDFNSLNIFYCTSSHECPIYFSKLIIGKNQCIDNCLKDEKYKYEYNNQCYEECPINTVLINNSNLCIDNYMRENNISQIQINEVIRDSNEIINKLDTDTNNNEFNVLNFFDDKCKKDNDSLSIDEAISNIENEILYGDLLLNIINGNRTNLVKKENNVIYSVSPLNNQEDEYYNLTTVDIGECEDRLRNNYGLNQNESLFIFKSEYYMDDLYFPIIKYVIYCNVIKEELNISICKDIKIKVNFPVSINEDNLFKHSSNSYYYDLCYSYTTEDNTDILLSDRQKEYNKNNMSLCESDCEFVNYNSDTKKVTCECQAKPMTSLIFEINNNKNKLFNKFKDIKNVAIYLSNKMLLYFIIDNFY